MPFKLGKPNVEFITSKAQGLVKTTWNKARGVHEDLPSGICPTCHEFITFVRGDRQSVSGANIVWDLGWKLLRGIPIGKVANVEMRMKDFDCACCRLILKLLEQCNLDTFPDPRAARLKLRPSLVIGISVGFVNLIVGARSCGKIFVQDETSEQAEHEEQSKLDEDELNIRTKQLQRCVEHLEHSSRSSGLDIGLVLEWLQMCEESHPFCNAQDFFGVQEPFSFMLIDVVEGRLRSLETSCRYIALSYVWGANQNSETMSSTLKNNLDSRKQHGALGRSESKLPRVIRDAMELVALMGQRFLWVDALCIVQDDAENKMAQIAKMDAIYSQTYMTIVAASGKSAHDPLPGLQPSTRAPIAFVERIPGLKFVSGPPSPAHVWDTLPIEGRAWTLQERLLSRRCLIFTPLEVYFHCQESLIQESISEENDQLSGIVSDFLPPQTLKKLYPTREEPADEDYMEEDVESGNEWPSSKEYETGPIGEAEAAYSQATAADGRRSDLSLMKLFGKSDGDPRALSTWLRTLGIKENLLAKYARGMKDELHGPQYQFISFYHAYKGLVIEYTSRNMTNPRDALNAFTATMSAFSRMSSSNFVAGLPEYCLDFALMWVAKTGLGSGSSASSSSSKAPTATGAVTTGFPTWSWVGRSARVDFLLRWAFLTMLGAYRGEMGPITVEEGEGRTHVVQRPGVLQWPTADQLPKPPPLVPLLPSSGIAVLHLWAQVISLQSLKDAGGKFMCTNCSSSIDNEHSPSGRLKNKAFQYLAGDFGPTTEFFLRGNLGWEYYDYLSTGLSAEDDMDWDLRLVLLSRLKWFPLRRDWARDDSSRRRFMGEYSFASKR